MTPKTAFVLAGTVIAGLIGGTYVWTQMRTTSACVTSGVAAGDVGGPFTLVSETGVTVTDADVITGPTLVYFGYTFCPDVCPLDTARNAAAIDLLAEMGHAVKPIFITVDPARDTPEQLAFFTDALHPEMLGLTGTEEQVQVAKQAYRAYGQKQPGDPEYYLVDHSTLTYLMLPETGFAGFYRRDLTPEALAAEVACVLDNI